jgi:hypothetical protein
MRTLIASALTVTLVANIAALLIGRAVHDARARHDARIQQVRADLTYETLWAHHAFMWGYEQDAWKRTGKPVRDVSEDKVRAR